MAHARTEARRSDRRAFRPTLDGRLEDRKLLSQLTAIRSRTAAGGQAVVITNIDKTQYFVSVVGGGSVRAFPATGGRVSLIVDGSTVDTLLEINQILPMHSQTAGSHKFNTTNQIYSRLNVASVTVTSGTIGAIEGYRDSILSGPIVVSGTNRVDRIAFEQVARGGSISVGGDLNTLEILNNADFNVSTGLTVGRDLNWFNVGGNLTFQNGARAVIGRDLGLTAQPAKGSGLAGQGLFVNGNLTVGPTSSVAIVRNNVAAIVVNGNLSGYSRISILGLPLPTYLSTVATNVVVRGTSTP